MNNVIQIVKSVIANNQANAFTKFVMAAVSSETIFFLEQRLVEDGYDLVVTTPEQADVVAGSDLSGRYKFGVDVSGAIEVGTFYEWFGEGATFKDVQISGERAVKIIAEHYNRNRNVANELRVLVPVLNQDTLEPWVTAAEVLRYVKNYATGVEAHDIEKRLGYFTETSQFKAVRLARYDDSRGNSNADRNEVMRILSICNDMSKFTLDTYPVSYRDLYKWLMGIASEEVNYLIAKAGRGFFTELEYEYFMSARRTMM